MTIHGWRSTRVATTGSAPSAVADWIELPGADDARGLHALPDAASDRTEPRAEVASGPTWLHVVGDPALERVPGGDPMVGMTLILSRAPGPSEATLAPLVAGAVLSLTVTTRPTEAELAGIAAERPATPLFPRGCRFALERGGSPAVALAALDVDGPSGVGALSATLGREDALEALRAFTGETSILAVVAEVGFRATVGPRPPLRVSVDLAATWDCLAAGTAGTTATDGIAEADLDRLLGAAITAGAVTIEGGAPGVATALGPTDATALAATLRTDLLRALLPVVGRVPGPDGMPARYRLVAARPSGRIMFLGRTAGGDVERRVRLERPLTGLLGSLAGGSLDRYVRAAITGADGTLQPIPARVAPSRAGPSADRAGPAGLATVGRLAAAMPAVLRTDPARANPLALSASDLAIRRPGRLHAWAVNDLVLHVDGAGEQLQSLPVIEGEAALWPDRRDASRFWYAPELSVAMPAPTDTAATSPYRFGFRVVGHDASGRPGLEASIRLTLRSAMSAATLAEWEAKGRPPVTPVPLDGASVVLLIPFRTSDGTAADQAIPAVEVQASADGLVASFGLTDQWARLAYGALSVRGFQVQPARIGVAYTFPAYVPVGETDGRVDWGGKIATLTRIDRLRVGGRVDPHPEWQRLDTLVIADGRAVPRPKGRFDGRLDAQLVLQPMPAELVVHPILIRPELLAPATVYGVRTQGRDQELELLLPCDAFGPLYVQLADPAAGDTGGDLPVGCRDAWTLGEGDPRLYERLEAVPGMPVSVLAVHRSLRVPGRFLVLPKAYTVTRYEPGDERAFRPAVYLFASLDAVDRSRSSCVVMATLRPAISPADRWAIVDALRAGVHPSPILEWPTELPVAPTYEWAIATSGASSSAIVPAVARTPEGFQASLSTGVDGILQLKAILENGGVSASVHFPLPDGQRLTTALALDLRRIDGPWDAGAVTVAVDGRHATLTNRAEKPADVTDVLVRHGATPLGAIPVERRLDPGGTATVDLPDGCDAAAVRYALVAGPTTLEEIRTFIEDIETTVVFVCTTDLAAAGVASVVVEARIDGVAGSMLVTLDPATTSGEAAFVLPLTTYLTQPTLHHRETTQPADGPPTVGAWHDWRLDIQGTVLEVRAGD